MKKLLVLILVTSLAMAGCGSQKPEQPKEPAEKSEPVKEQPKEESSVDEEPEVTGAQEAGRHTCL